MIRQIGRISSKRPTTHVLGWCDSRTEFEFTLELLLDGLDQRRVIEAKDAV